MIPTKAVEAACDTHHWASTHVPGYVGRWVIQCSLCETYNVEEMNAAIEAELAK